MNDHPVIHPPTASPPDPTEHIAALLRDALNVLYTDREAVRHLVQHEGY